MAQKRYMTLSDPKPFKLLVSKNGCDVELSISTIEMAKMVAPNLGLLLLEYERVSEPIPIKDVTKMVKLYMLKFKDKSTFRMDMLEDLYSKTSTPTNIGHLVVLSLTLYQLILAGIAKPLENYIGWEEELNLLSETLCLPF